MEIPSKGPKPSRSVPGDMVTEKMRGYSCGKPIGEGRSASSVPPAKVRMRSRKPALLRQLKSRMCRQDPSPRGTTICHGLAGSTQRRRLTLHRSAQGQRETAQTVPPGGTSLSAPLPCAQRSTAYKKAGLWHKC